MSEPSGSKAMPRITHRYVTDLGELYRMTERNYQRFRAALRENIDTEPAGFGVFVGHIDLDLAHRSEDSFLAYLED